MPPLSRSRVRPCDPPLPITCQAVIDFHSGFYSANICRLAVFGRHSLDELEAMVRPRFSAVPNKQGAPLEVATDVFLDSQVRELISFVWFYHMGTGLS